MQQNSRKQPTQKTSNEARLIYYIVTKQSIEHKGIYIGIGIGGATGARAPLVCSIVWYKSQVKPNSILQLINISAKVICGLLGLLYYSTVDIKAILINRKLSATHAHDLFYALKIFQSGIC